MKRNKDFYKIGYRKDYFDTDLFYYVMKRMDDPRGDDEWWYELHNFIDLRNRNIWFPNLYDKNSSPALSKEEFKEK